MPASETCHSEDRVDAANPLEDAHREFDYDCGSASKRRAFEVLLRLEHPL